MGRLVLPETAISHSVDKMLGFVGRSVSWLWLVLLACIVVNVVMRYLFDEGHIELEELQWHLYSVGFLIGLSYAYQADTHVRVDIVSLKLSERMQAWLELYGILLALLPFVILVIWYGLPFAALSFTLGEVSQAPGGLPFRWIIKAVLPFSFMLLLLAIIARFTRVCAFLFGTNVYSTTFEKNDFEKREFENTALENNA
ncbi:MAG: TRAP transporter small permease subunit, partial [Pseudomonadales bacterium]|nr:TRAP transporter small permease subunit [Pseudomonadales bacterium]